MRGVNSIFWIIALSAFVVVLYVLFGLPNVDAITRDELNDLKVQHKQAEDRLIELETELASQRILINEQDKTNTQLKQELREIQIGSDWESLRLKQDLEKSVQDGYKLLSEYRDGLKSILTERSDTIKFLKSINLNVPVESKNDYSHLVKKIGISLSKSCVTMLKNNFETNCPTYKQLLQLDSSNRDISGRFGMHDGFFQRGPEQVENSFRFYNNDPTIRIFVDPPASTETRIKMIYIQPNFDVYTLVGDMTVHDEFETVQGNSSETFGNVTKTKTFDDRVQVGYFGTVLYHDRFVDKCKSATINANNWKFLIGDTIHFMRNNCDRNYTSFEEREVIFPEYSEIDLTTSPNWVYQQWLKHTQEFCIYKYKACT